MLPVNMCVVYCLVSLCFIYLLDGFFSVVIVAVDILFLRLALIALLSYCECVTDVENVLAVLFCSRERPFTHWNCLLCCKNGKKR